VEDLPVAIEQAARELASTVAALDLEQRVSALNAVRAILHEVSPFKTEPVDLVLWHKAERVAANDYNPNAVAPPEMQLLKTSIEADGYTQPIVTSPTDSAFEIVDGFHRNRVGRECEAVRERIHGYLPLVIIPPDRQGKSDRIAATIRHNRARGEHDVDRMSAIVRMLYEAGWPDDKIQAELGMDLDEVTRLKQLTGLAALFADREYSEAWEAD
jgi:ParB-like chromosome segregation protein Spo0J